MVEEVRQMKMSDAGNVTGFFSSSLPDHGESSAADARPQTKDSLLDDLQSLKGHKAKPAVMCSVALVMQEMEPSEVEILQRILEDDTIRGAWISEILNRYGYKVPAASLQRHRRRAFGRGCACP